ncbi:hypothetical protein MASR2M15_11250 [Anaerolineales bacterium]
MNIKYCLIPLLILLIAACSPTEEPATDVQDPIVLLQEAVDQIQSYETFHMILEQTGAPYYFGIAFDEGDDVIGARLLRAQGQFINPDELFANVKLNIGLTASVDLFARGDDQWLRPPASKDWVHFPFAEGFDPGRILAADAGLQAALSTLQNIEYMGLETLIDGSQAYHIKGTASGEVVNDLMFGLLTLENDVDVDIYIDQVAKNPSQIIVTMPETITAEDPEPTRWVIEIFDINAEPSFEYPGAAQS